MVAWSNRIVGRKWDRHKSTSLKWYQTEALGDYIRREICPEHETGVPGALRAALGGERLGRGISIGAGSGAKEMALQLAGLVDRFDLFELSEVRAAAARTRAAETGLGDKVEVRVADAFATPRSGAYDLVNRITLSTTCSTSTRRSLGASTPCGQEASSW